MRSFKALPTEMRVPAQLDARILAAASAKAEKHRRSCRLVFAVASAAAVLLAVCGTLYLPHWKQRSDISREELLSMADWGNISQETWMLSAEINMYDDLAESQDEWSF